jgi:predicted transcriptional regulator
MTKARIHMRRDADVMAQVDAMASRFVGVWKTGEAAPHSTVLTFSSPAQLFSNLSPKRCELIERLQTLGPSTIRGLARALERDVKRVHEDVSVLVEWGLVEKDAASKVFVPFDEIEADFVLRGAAA